jgi:hypothetical protein
MMVSWLLALVLAQAAPQSHASARNDDGGARAASREAAALPASIDLRSDLGKRFRLVESHVVLDGRELSNRVAAPGQELQHSFRAFDGPVSPGPHSLTVTLVYEGRNPGPITYLDEYRFRAQSTADFTAERGTVPAAIQVLAYERKGATVPLEQRPVIEIKTAPGSNLTPAPATTQQSASIPAAPPR